MDEVFEKGMEPTEYAISDDDRDPGSPLLPAGLHLQATCITWCERLFLSAKCMYIYIYIYIYCLAWAPLELALSLARVHFPFCSVHCLS